MIQLSQNSTWSEDLDIIEKNNISLLNTFHSYQKVVDQIPRMLIANGPITRVMKWQKKKLEKLLIDNYDEVKI